MTLTSCNVTNARTGAWRLDLPVTAGRGNGAFLECDRPERFDEPRGGGADGDALTLSVPTTTLWRGASGREVRLLQTKLAEAGFGAGRIDGDFGPRTRQAVMRFQRAHRLTVDGIVGADTWQTLFGARSPVPAPAPGARPRRPVLSPVEPGGAVSTAAGPMVRRGNELISTRIAPMYDRMRAAAAEDGVDLRIKDGYRSHREQTILWNRYGRDRRRVGRPGHSNHQTGTAIDFADTPGAWRWLKRHAPKFGLRNYAPEPWHYSLTGR